MLKTMLSISASAERRACASAAVRGMAEPTSAGAKLVMVLFIFVAMFVRALMIIGAARAVALEADMVTILGEYCSAWGKGELTECGELRRNGTVKT